MILKTRNPGRFRPPPARLPHSRWCVQCSRPDPGVVEHRSRTWTAGPQADADVSWRLMVTQRVEDGRPERAVVDVESVCGAFGNVGSIIAALLEAQELADELNAGASPREQVRP